MLATNEADFASSWSVQDVLDCKKKVDFNRLYMEASTDVNPSAFRLSKIGNVPISFLKYHAAFTASSS